MDKCRKQRDGINAVIHSHDMSKANVHDIHYLQDIKHEYSRITIIGDKGYLSTSVLDLFERSGIRSEVAKSAHILFYNILTLLTTNPLEESIMRLFNSANGLFLVKICRYQIKVVPLHGELGK